MNVHWVQIPSDNALETLKAVERALLANARDAAAPQAAASEPDQTERLLHENIALAHQTWSVDPHQIVVSFRAGVGKLINGFQHCVRQLTWWFTLPQWLQISQFHGAVVRALDALILREQRQDQRLSLLEQPRTAARTEALERQVELLLAEQLEFKRRIDLLERQLKQLRTSQEDKLSERSVGSVED